ncbi:MULTISPECIES: GNAT family N-acetyltransferase [unclassified Pseudomonas]|uniref:GNAT family N-acetyltransferase n=1 Tax=unclassified Pseudomonas TaxID=196821 RepID=UPI002A3716F5|nr:MULTISPECIES: GNAT family N-acetyltransferase [unclassified Pseudomonas]MDX9669182.1 GNAT family N-acetyltransferase [Pseudomonas sp. P8_250]WPN36774.1 GNAT family N-acetyltransferase [Pseudomonas sp. P8_139]WPN41425.1 GNAT family N-acetyltransferase [Pseudomonas sp. P8_229]
MTLTIRPARATDASALPAIERSAAELFRVDPALAWLADSDVASAAQHRQAIEQAHVWVAESATAQLAGFIRALDVGNQLHIEELSVSQAFQGQGAGRRLVMAAIEHARHRQMRAVTLTTFRDVPWNAPFYQRMGFVVAAPGELEAHLIEALQKEVEHGFAAERRCAMRLRLL